MSDLRKKVEPDDPMELRGVQCDGEPDLMIECLAEEFVRMGWTEDRIVRLFESPFYPVLHALYQSKGAASIRKVVHQVSARWGVFRVRTVEAAEADELVTISPSSEEGVQNE
jgi:hypothetical protein